MKKEDIVKIKCDGSGKTFKIEKVMHKSYANRYKVNDWLWNDDDLILIKERKKNLKLF